MRKPLPEKTSRVECEELCEPAPQQRKQNMKTITSICVKVLAVDLKEFIEGRNKFKKTPKQKQ